MSLKHAFKPTSFDALEAREVMSHASVVHAAVAHHASAVHKPVTPHTYAAQFAAFTKANAFTTRGGAAVTPYAVTAATTMTNVSPDLNAAYATFQSNGGNGSALAARYSTLRFSGNSVGVEVKTTAAGFSAELTQLRNLGMTVTMSSAPYALIEGYLPINALPTASALPQTVSITPNYKPVTNAPAPVPVTTPPAPSASTGSLANTSNDLKSLYAAFQSNGGNGAALAARYSTLRISGNSVGVDIKTSAAGFNALVAQLTNLGMTITTSSASYGLVEGYLPIANLPSASTLPQTISINPNYKPVTNGGYHL